ncbi:hypothetical protein B5S28_g3116 [[Candida] boidinii]|nr:hypothetical protein B5S28_g3116 [[Candida] boidinii]OWB62385.1 hypothetical protein B5S29_g3311 [[Candida] boidinii]OWB74414.1 hypothetical protein B5S31_g4206 [[Candida] boidinii]
MSVSHKRRNTDPLDSIDILDSSSHDSKRRLIENLSTLNINGNINNDNGIIDNSNSIFCNNNNNNNNNNSIDNFKNQVFLGDASSSIRKQHFEKVSNSRSSSRSGSKSPIYNNNNSSDYYNPDEPIYISNIDKFLYDNPDDRYEDDTVNGDNGRITDYSKIQVNNLYIPNTKSINELFNDSARSTNEIFLNDKLKFSYNRIYSQKRREILNNKDFFIKQLQKDDQDKMIDETYDYDDDKNDNIELEIANRIKVTNAEIYYDQYMLENYSLIKYYSPFQLIFESLRNWVYEMEMGKRNINNDESKIEEIDMVDEDQYENDNCYFNSGINNNNNNKNENEYENQTSDYGSYYHTPDIDNDDDMIYDAPMEMD